MGIVDVVGQVILSVCVVAVTVTYLWSWWRREHHQSKHPKPEPPTCDSAQHRCVRAPGHAGMHQDWQGFCW